MWPFRSKPKRIRRTVPVTLHAKYDAAQTTRENIRHWAMADGLSADLRCCCEVSLHDGGRSVSKFSQQLQVVCCWRK